MDCARCEDLLFEELEGRLAPAHREPLDEHLRDCPRCRELGGLLLGGAVADVTAIEVPEGLLPAVLDRTSGAVNRAMTRMLRELPALAELEPDDDFVLDVLSATIGAHAARRAQRRMRLERVWAPWRERATEILERLAQRPRLALEGAYAGVLVAMLLLGLPSPSVAALPVRAFDGIRQEALNAQRAVAEQVNVAFDYGHAAWQDSTGRVSEYLDAGASEVLEAPQVQRASGWLAAVRDMAAGIWQHLFAPVAREMRALWSDAMSDDVPVDGTPDSNR
ncbi:MAG: zf-HC2 domain-containing protein [Acidobacteriota bacterium]|jgi:hypothetical protein